MKSWNQIWDCLTSFAWKWLKQLIIVSMVHNDFSNIFSFFKSTDTSPHCMETQRHLVRPKDSTQSSFTECSARQFIQSPSEEFSHFNIKPKQLLLLLLILFVIATIIHMCRVFPSYPDDVLAGGDGQTHQAGAVDGHDAVTDAELAAALCWTSMKEVGHHHSGQDGAPTWLHHRQPQDLSRSLCDGDLNHRHRKLVNQWFWFENINMVLQHTHYTGYLCMFHTCSRHTSRRLHSMCSHKVWLAITDAEPIIWPLNIFIARGRLGRAAAVSSAMVRKKGN